MSGRDLCAVGEIANYCRVKYPSVGFVLILNDKAKLVICELFTSISKDPSQQSISMTPKRPSRNKDQPARNEPVFWPSLGSIALILIL